jgi:hypothetical protein
MARVSSDPDVRDDEQLSPFAGLADDDQAVEERLPAKTVVIGGEPIRKGDRKPEKEELDTPMRASPEPEPQRDDEGVTELKRQLFNQQQMTARATQVAQAEFNARVNAERGMAAANTATVDAAIGEATRMSEQAAMAFQAALDRGDHAGATRAQIALSDTRANLLRLHEQKAMLEEAPPQRQQPQPQRQQTFQPTSEDNVRNLSGHLDRTGYPKSAAWIRAHPEAVRDRQGIDDVDSAHKLAVNKFKLIPETQAYFDKIEELLEMGEPPVREAPRREPRPMGQRMAAPARNDSPRLSDGRTRRQAVQLTSRQREHAREVLGMTDEEYAEALLDAQASGKMLGTRA